VRGVYDRHEYADEKRDALEKLGAGRAHSAPGRRSYSFPERTQETLS
jgi:hypothetical protein